MRPTGDVYHWISMTRTQSAPALRRGARRVGLPTIRQIGTLTDGRTEPGAGSSFGARGRRKPSHCGGPRRAPPEAESNIRGYYTANPQEYHELRGILASIGDTQRQCSVSVLPPDLASDYDEFMAG
jgi:Haemophore, haem-binding